MEKTEAKQRIDELKEKLNEANRSYYILDAPEISDFEYDKLIRELIVLEEEYPEYKTQDSPSQRVGGGVLEGFEQVTHAVQMQSLSLIHICIRPFRKAVSAS